MSLNFNERRSHCIMVISQGLQPATPNWVIGGGGGLLEILDVLNRGVRIKIGPLPLPRPRFKYKQVLNGQHLFPSIKPT
jgi:hypothetical protein